MNAHVEKPPYLLSGDLEIPEGARAVVLFAHGSGSSRFSPRNRYVAQTLNRAGLGTLLMDLLTEEEDSDPSLRFDIQFLANRLLRATEWLGHRTRLLTGYFGASTGAAAALAAAAQRPNDIYAIVSRGGRPDLAGDALESVLAPTLLIVGGMDRTVLELNRRALHRLRAGCELAVVPGATHLFEEPGALDEVARLAQEWFTKHLPKADLDQK